MKLKTKKNSLQIDSINKSKNKKKNKSQDVDEQPQQERVNSKKLGKGKDRSRGLQSGQRKRSDELELVQSERSDEPEVVQTEEIVDRGINQVLGDDHSQDDSDGNDDNDHGRAEESDSSEDEVAPRNTIGAVPLEWYKEEEHIGYNIAGKKIKKKERQDKLDSFLARVDDAKTWRTIYDDLEDEDVELLNREIKTIRRMLKGNAPHPEFDPHAPYIDFFKWVDAKHPLSSAPEPKRRFIPSKSDLKKVVRYVRLIRKGLIKFDKPKEEPKFYPLWGDDATRMDRSSHALAYIPAPKTKLPGHEESYNPSLEYIPTQEEINKYELMFEEDRPKFIPKRFESLRSVPAYENLKEMFDRCLDLYLCPRVRKKRINIDPESLKPKLPSPRDLKPYPVMCYLEYKGHSGAVMSISPDASGQWIASGSSDGTVRIWEVETCRCVKVWELGEAVHYVAWNPLSELSIIAVAMGHDVLILNTGLGTEEQQNKIAELLRVGTLHAPDESDDARSILTWAQYNKYDGIRLEHFKTVTSVEWHRKGDYFSTVMPAAESRAILMHQLSKKVTQKIPFKLHGLPVSSVFHPTRSVFFISTKKNVRVYDLVKKKLIKKLETGVREVSSIAVHPAGDNVIVGSKDGKLCWFDMDLSSQPYRVLRCHPKDITNVAFHRSYPLFASSSDDCTAYVFHGMVYSDLNQNPLIVPLEILRGHKNNKGGGVLDCKFHPRQPWLFTAGADSSIKLYCH